VGELLGKAARSGKRSVQTATSSEFFDFRLLQRRAELTCSVLGHLRCGIFAISLLSAVIRCCDYSPRVRLLASGSSSIFGHIRTLVYLTPRHDHECHLQYNNSCRVSIRQQRLTRAETVGDSDLTHPQQ
jgi:hypothetical protein